MPRRRLPRISTRRLALASAGTAILLAAAACASAPSSPGQSSGKINLTYAQWQTAETPGYQKSVQVFEKAHPNIHVTIETFPYPNYQAKLTTEFSSGGGPDIFWVVKFPIGVMPFPGGPKGNWTVLNGLIDSINSHGPHQQAAWELEKWLGSPASQKILGAGGYIWPGIPSLDPLFLKYWRSKGIDMQPFLTEARWHTVFWPVTPGMNQAQLDIEHQLAPAYLNGKNVPGAVSAAAKQANGDLATAG